jgi:transposase
LSAPIGEDGYTLLAGIDQAAAQQAWAWLKELPAVRIREQTWAQPYRPVGGHAQRLSPKEVAPVSEWYRSPSDQEGRDGRKRDCGWIGYQGHLTACCADALPHVMTPVATAPATQQDHHALQAIQAELADQDLLPQQHLVDAGDISAKRLIESRDTPDIDLMGPVPVDPSWQAHTPGAFAVSRFHIDWSHQVVTCPQGEHSVAWHHGKDAKGESVVQVWFAQPTCPACPLRAHCTTAQATGRSMTLRFPQERHEMLQAARARQQTPGFHDVYQREFDNCYAAGRASGPRSREGFLGSWQ